MEKPSARRILAENLRLARILRRLSQEALAEMSYLDRSYVSALERAEVNIGVDNLEKIARALGASLVELLTEPDPQRLGVELLDSVRSAVDRKRGGGVREEWGSYLIAGR